MSDVTYPVLQALRQTRPVFWINPQRQHPPGPSGADTGDSTHAQEPGPSLAMLHQARQRFERFAPLLADLFEALHASQGHISSPLLRTDRLQQALQLSPQAGQLWVKADHSLPVAGSVKARGGFHEILEHTEQLCTQLGLLGPTTDVRSLASDAVRQRLRHYQVAVGSTGNLGLSIGVMAAALGYQAVVHLSAQAKTWKKQRLRDHGVVVMEHSGDYAQAVAQGREQARDQPHCHFVDDERSLSLFLGYACAAFELQSQLAAQGVRVDAQHPLHVYLPCGVGGAPAGIVWGLAQLLGPHVHGYMAEPVQSPCFLLGMLSAPEHTASVYDLGLSNQTEADGLAVARASPLALALMRPRLAGAFTVSDQTLMQHLALAHDHEGLLLEPSAAAGFSGPQWLQQKGLTQPQATHVVWTTGGSLVPASAFRALLRQGRQCLQARAT